MTILIANDSASPKARVAQAAISLCEALGGAFRGLLRAYRTHRERQIAIAYLHSFNDYELRDIGLRRGSIEAAVFGLYPDASMRDSCPARRRD